MKILYVAAILGITAVATNVSACDENAELLDAKDGSKYQLPLVIYVKEGKEESTGPRLSDTEWRWTTISTYSLNEDRWRQAALEGNLRRLKKKRIGIDKGCDVEEKNLYNMKDYDVPMLQFLYEITDEDIEELLRRRPILSSHKIRLYYSTVECSDE